MTKPVMTATELYAANNPIGGADKATGRLSGSQRSRIALRPLALRVIDSQFFDNQSDLDAWKIDMITYAGANFGLSFPAFSKLRDRFDNDTLFMICVRHLLGCEIKQEPGVSRDTSVKLGEAIRDPATHAHADVSGRSATEYQFGRHKAWDEALVTSLNKKLKDLATKEVGMSINSIVAQLGGSGAAACWLQARNMKLTLRSSPDEAHRHALEEVSRYYGDIVANQLDLAVIAGHGAAIEEVGGLAASHSAFEEVKAGGGSDSSAPTPAAPSSVLVTTGLIVPMTTGGIAAPAPLSTAAAEAVAAATAPTTPATPPTQENDQMPSLNTASTTDLSAILGDIASTNSYSLDAVWRTAINGMLHGPGIGAKFNMEELIEKANEAGKVPALVEAVKGLETKLARAKTAASTVAYKYEAMVQGSLNIPTVREEVTNAFEFVRMATGMRVNELKNIDMTYYVSIDASGKEYSPLDKANHPSKINPLVPEIDPNYQGRKDFVLRYVTASERRHNIFAWGDTGTGKSTFFEWMCALTGKMFIRINLDSGIDRMHFVGKDSIKAGPSGAFTEFVEGVLVQAMKLPCLFVCDEIDFAASDVLYVLQRVLEGKGLLLPEEGNRMYQANPGFRLAATANTNGQGDERAVYRGAKELSLAFRNRFQTWFKVGYMAKDQEAKLLGSLYPTLPTDIVNRLTDFAKEIRQAFRDGTIMETVSPRDLCAIADLFLIYEKLKPAVEQVISDRLSDMDKQVVEGIVDRTIVR